MSTPKERPILFSAPMVRAILDGSKTQTRRAVSLKRFSCVDWVYASVGERCHSLAAHAHGTPGDRLWVRETFAEVPWEPGPTRFLYRADNPSPSDFDPERGDRWRPSIFMPRIASRILLEITDVCVQRLQDISEDDARAEGYDKRSSHFPTGWFRYVWENINGNGSWDTNPWVWAITFRRLQP